MGIAESFKVLSEPVRREILMMLKDERMAAGEIAKRLDISPAALSYHLRLLKGADLVFEYKEKNFVYYALNATVMDEIILWFRQFKQGLCEEGSRTDTDNNRRCTTDTARQRKVRHGSADAVGEGVHI